MDIIHVRPEMDKEEGCISGIMRCNEKCINLPNLIIDRRKFVGVTFSTFADKPKRVLDEDMYVTILMSGIPPIRYYIGKDWSDKAKGTGAIILEVLVDVFDEEYLVGSQDLSGKDECGKFILQNKNLTEIPKEEKSEADND